MGQYGWRDDRPLGARGGDEQSDRWRGEREAMGPRDYGRWRELEGRESGWRPDWRGDPRGYDERGYGGYGERPQGRWGGYPGERREYSEWGRPGVDWPGAPEEPRGLIELEDRGPLDWLADKVRRLKSKRPRGPKGYKRSDERIHEDVCERIARSGVDLDDVEVKVENGEVTLTGTVRDRVEKWRLEGLADDVFGVEDVHNYLRILRVERPAERGMAGRMEAGTKPSDVSH